MGADRSILIFAASALVSVCAVLSAFGFRGRVSVIGVDLGTTYSVVAVAEKGVVRVLPSDEDDNVLTPSTVAFAPHGHILVGRAAQRHARKDATHVIYDAKRFIGRRFDDPSVTQQAETYAFHTVPSLNTTDAAFAVDVKLGHGVDRVSPETVGSLVVKKLRDAAETALGHGVRAAVICVPAGFNSQQIVATHTAFKLAGLHVARVVKEPVAAACAYGLHKRADVRHVLVFDFGGGTLDVSVLYIQDESVEVVATAGDNDLGGTDFDQCLAESFVSSDSSSDESSSSRRRRTNDDANLGGDAPQTLTLEELPPREEQCRSENDPVPLCAPHVLLRLAEEIKVELSDAARATRYCLAGPSCDALRPVALTVDRADFETRLCGHLFDKALAVVRAAVVDARIHVDEIDEVVLVGGTSRIPKVRDILRRELNMTTLNTDIDPDVTVAVGAASILD